MPRLLTIMGSGETAPTMVKTHRRLLEATDGSAVMLDTPYGFQENADDISARAQTYFRTSVGHTVDIASWRSADDDAVTRERALGAVAAAGSVFAGPGSPTYALRLWDGSDLPALLAEKLRTGGVVTFASAAALTLGVVSVPVYEIYKVGATPAWVPGLDLLGAFGLHVAVIPHFDNREGGNHDTRFCYLGERRLRMLEAELPEGAWVLGVDEHTALVVDLEAGAATVEGNSAVTVRDRGSSHVFEAGSTVDLDQLRPGAAMRSRPGVGPRQSPEATAPPTAIAESGGTMGLAADLERQTAAFDAALANGDVDAAVAAVLDLEQAIVDWSADTLQSDDTDRARAALRRMVVRLGELAAAGARDPRTVVGPFVEAVLAARVDARGAQQYDLADRLRDDLVDAGVEVRDTPDGTEWVLRDQRDDTGR